MTGRVLIVDDEPNVRQTMEMIHKSAGWETASVESGFAALERLQDERFDLVYLDLVMPERGGIEVFKDIKLRVPDQTVVILTGQGTIEKAVEATKLGAFDFLEKDCGKEKILLTSRNALEHRTLAEENRMLRGKLPKRQEFLGKSKDYQEVLQQIGKVAPTNARVLIFGESGTGKELIAREIHERSKRSGKPFVKVNCAAIPEELIEAELFGSVKGAYTGSVASREGKFQAADGGTIFLDEVGDMSLRVQTKVLRAIQEGEIERVGSDKSITVDVRVLAATNKNLEEEIAAGRFREDLFFRLNVVPIVAKPLRAHPEEIPLLVGAFLKSYCIENGLPEKKLDDRVMELLKKYPWPGNVRELRNQVERLVIMSPGRTVHVEDLSSEIRSGEAAVVQGERGAGARDEASARHAAESTSEAAPGGMSAPEGLKPDALPNSLPLQEAKKEFERRMILEALERNAWNVTRTAGELGMERTALHKKMKAHGLEKKKE
jgi:two-component system nitrogen regulation response regulator NtrX